jgi:hypothetical protein
MKQITTETRRLWFNRAPSPHAVSLGLHVLLAVGVGVGVGVGVEPAVALVAIGWVVLETFIGIELVGTGFVADGIP